VAIVIQLLTSLVMRAPRGTRPGDAIFEIHEYSGYAALGFAALFWAVLMLRAKGTSAGALVPWFSRRRWAALIEDTRAHIASARRLNFPDMDDHRPMVSAIHGLGLLLMTLMAVTGTASVLFPDIRGQVLDIHETFANLVWAYLIGHAGLALLAHWTRHLDLREMWRFDH
jgi:cytochrome b561